jgi:hypothetical protein
MPSVDNLPDDKELHQMIIMKIWKDIAADIYRAYLEIGRGVVAMFMMDTMPEMLKDVMPEGEGVISGSVMTAYIPLDKLNTLEDLVGLEGVLKIDEQVHRYDPTTSIVFAFFNKKVNSDGTRGVSSCGYEITPHADSSPLELYKKKGPVSVRKIFPEKRNDHPLINLN